MIPKGMFKPILRLQLPATLGSDLAGVVVEVGGSVTRFKPGDAVITRNWQPRGHTRLPGYARGHRGRIHLFHGVYILPDAHAHGRGRCPEPLYSVGFESGELWGDAAEPKERVYIDLWESYLHPPEA